MNQSLICRSNGINYSEMLFDVFGTVQVWTSERKARESRKQSHANKRSEKGDLRVTSPPRRGVQSNPDVKNAASLFSILSI